MQKEDDVSQDQISRASERIGRFLYEFARMERVIDDAIAVIFELPENYASIISSNIDISKKINIVHSACLYQISPGDIEQTKRINEIFNKIKGINNPDRTMIAHSLFDPTAHGGVRFSRVRSGLKVIDKDLSFEEFETKYGKIISLTAELADLTRELSPYNVTKSLSQASNKTLRRMVLELTARMRLVEAEYNQILRRDMFGSGEKRISAIIQISSQQQEIWRDSLKPEAIALYDEMIERTGYVVPTDVSEVSDHYMLKSGGIAGPDPLDSIATLLEKLSRLLED